MAAGITATPFALTGNAERPLGGSIGSGSPILTLDNNGEGFPRDLSATVDWGDGTTVDSATFLGIGNADNQIDKLQIYGDSHIYTQAGLYNVTIAITGLNNPAATYQTTATIGDPLPDPPITVARRSLVGTAGSLLSSTPNVAPLTGSIPLMTLEGTSKTLPINNVTATIDWGDGSATDAATLGGSLGIESDTRGLDIRGPQHIYAQAGTYTITIAFTGLNDPSATYQTTATIALKAVTARPVSVSGTAGNPVDSPIGTSGPLGPTATTVPLLNLDGTATSLPITGATATINWGDGSALDAASLFGSLGIEDGSRGLAIYGPQHVYASPGTYLITIALTDPSAAYQTTATIARAITGQLNPLSDSGVSSSDGITNVTTPNFVGTTTPGGTVVLYATSAANPNFTIPVGVGMADASGNWSISTVPFADGSYTIVATTTSQAGYTTNLTLAPLIIDANGPTILSAQVTNALTGTFAVSFSDPYGLTTAPLTNASNYVVTRTTPRPRRGQTFAVTNLTASPGSAVSSSPVQVTGQLSTGTTPLSRNGTYLLTIRSAAIQSLAGTALNGSFDGHFPTGGGSAGSDFQIRVQIRNGKQVKLAAVHPVRATNHPVRASATAHNRSIKG